MTQSKLGINDFVPVITRGDASGRTWTEPAPLWPELANQSSIFCSLSRDRAGNLFVFGTQTPIHQRGESFWCEKTKGLKQNELIWAQSADDGITWSRPQAFALPWPGSAEAAAPLLVTRGGRWIAPYSPYNVFDPSVRVDRSRVIAVISDDHGKAWRAHPAIRLQHPQAGGAEAWLTELDDGTLIGTTWQVDLSGHNMAYPNLYAISHNGGDSWSPTQSTGIVANTTALTPLSEGRALFTTVRRRDDAGIWLSVIRPTETDFGVLADQQVWSSSHATQSRKKASHDAWTDFSFGEPCVTQLSDGSLLMMFWYLDQTRAAICYLKLLIVK